MSYIITNYVRVNPITKKIRENHLRWFGHMHKSHAPMKKSESIQAVGTKKGKGRSKITLVEVVKKKKPFQLRR